MNTIAYFYQFTAHLQNTITSNPTNRSIDHHLEQP